ncbi:MAG TPA: adenylosuccinate lyase, partial [Bacteroidota bacterium]|nr:adenylosuccinate lyase [Bacteroidota bacterium]
RIVIPDSCILLDYMLAEFTKIVENLVVYPEQMKRNLGLTNGLIFSQAVLLELAKKGMRREDAYRVVQAEAMKAWETKQNFQELLKNNGEIKKYLSEAELNKLFDLQKSVKNVEYIFQQVGIQ